MPGSSRPSGPRFLMAPMVIRLRRKNCTWRDPSDAVRQSAFEFAEAIGSTERLPTGYLKSSMLAGVAFPGSTVTSAWPRVPSASFEDVTAYFPGFKSLNE
jgi:hypothetical protein